MYLFWAACVAGMLLGLPLLTGAIALVENLRAGELPLLRCLNASPLPLALLRGYCDAVWTLWLTALLLPFGRLVSPDVRPAGTREQDVLPPVILVHGLYHNPAAWWFFRTRLKAAGFTDIRCHAYKSFGQGFVDIAAGLAEHMRDAAADDAQGRVLLVGHSLGGLVIRAAWARCAGNPGVRVAGVVTLGTPHRGSTLAGILGLGRLARGLRPGGEVLRLVEALPSPEGEGLALSLHTPTDAMVLPMSGALLPTGLAPCWGERTLGPMSHVGLLYSREAAALAVAFLKGRCRG